MPSAAMHPPAKNQMIRCEAHRGARAMFGTHDLWLFGISGLLLNVTPGPDMLYIIGRSTAQGWRAGAAAPLGGPGGCFVHSAAPAPWLSALLCAPAPAF